MKKTHIIGLILVAIAIGIILITTGDASTYVGFDEAERISKSDPTQKVHVVGKLKKAHFLFLLSSLSTHRRNR